MINDSLLIAETLMEFDAAQRRRQALAGDPQPLCDMLFPNQLFDDFQRDIIRSVISPDFAEVFVKGCAKAGKGAAVAVAVNLWFFLHRASRIILTSQSYHHCVDVMFAECLLWRRRMAVASLGEPGVAGYRHDESHYLIIANPSTGEGFSGHHGPQTLFVFDEATSTTNEYYDLAGTQAKKIVALANPRTTAGWFRRGFDGLGDPDVNGDVSTPKGIRHCITISGADCMNVKTGASIIPDQLTLAGYRALCAHPDSAWVDIFAHGRFAQQDPERRLIARSWLPRHAEHWRTLRDAKESAVCPECDGMPEEGCAECPICLGKGVVEASPLVVGAFGLDVADSEGGDETVLAAGGVKGCLRLHRRQKSDTMQTVLWVQQTAREYGIELADGQMPICVDADGLGKGVADRLDELGCWTIYWRGGESPEDRRSYVNRRAEGYGELAARLDPAGKFSEPWAIPDDSRLFEELCAHEREYGSDAIRFKLTPKRAAPGGPPRRTVTEVLHGRSPDSSDALVYLFWAVRVGYGLEPNDAAPPVWNVEAVVEEEGSRIGRIGRMRDRIART